MWHWLQANYSLAALWSAWGAVVLGYVGFFFLERLLPAYRNPKLAADVRANLVFFFLNPISLFSVAGCRARLRNTLVARAFVWT